MKKIKLFALAAFAMLSTNAFAQTYDYAIKDGVWYKYQSDDATYDGSAAKPYQAKVFAIKLNDEGVTELSIPKGFTWTNQADATMYFNVTGFEANWEGQTATDVDGDTNADEFEYVVQSLTSLTVNIDNFAEGAIANLTGTLKKLTSLTLIDETTAGTPAVWTPKAHTVAELNINDNLKTKLTTLNLKRTGVTMAVGGEFKVNNSTWAKLTSITLPDGLTQIGVAANANGTFEGFKGTAITIPATVTAINDKAFKGATGLTSIEIPAATATIATSAFEGCTGLTAVTFATNTSGPNTGKSDVATIGNDAFKGCTGLTSLDLSKTAIVAGLGAPFTGCTGITAISLPVGLTTLADDVFKDTKIEEINAPGATIVGTIMGAPSATTPNTTLKKVTLGAAPIATLTFQYCQALEEVTIAFDDATITNASDIDAKAFYYCTALTTFNFTDADGYAQYVDDDAFLGCSSNPLVHFVTTTAYQTAFPTAPKQTTYGNEAATTVTTKADKGTSGKFFAKYKGTAQVYIDPADAKVYSVYVDEGTAYFQALAKRKGLYQIDVNECVIIKTDEEKEVEIHPFVAGGFQTSVLIDDIYSPAADEPFATYQENNMNAGEYLYRLTNNAASGGFGFTYFSGTTMKKDQFFIVSNIAPAAGRLNIVWLDEDGNVESDATAINGIVKKAQNDGIIYNLAGQKVNASYKGVVIKDGKKMIMK